MMYQFIPVGIFLGSLIVPLCVAFGIRHQRRGRRSPLTVQLLRSPGESLIQQIEDIKDDIDLYFMLSTVTPLMLFAIYLSVRFMANEKINWIMLLFACAVSMVIFALKLASLLRKKNSLCLGLDCERAVGQELNHLMLDGYRVFHDFPADNFNVDHVVIGTSGVFAVETKGRAKPLKGDVKIIFDGHGVQFPTHYEREPVEQAVRQADWLAKWLTSAVGAQVAARPVLVFPGWYIERKKPGLLICNGKNPQAVFKVQGEVALSTEMIQRISHQIEQRCRDVEALAYKKLKPAKG